MEKFCKAFDLTTIFFVEILHICYKLLKLRTEMTTNKTIPITTPMQPLRRKILLCDLLVPNQKTIKAMQDIEKGKSLKQRL